ncbi:DUF308 domain-containing protein [Candidatus Saccharibacteria bacterium]|nr:DUF308 domain-containing protein [Candidatus Saccharibacteria bacterium]
MNKLVKRGFSAYKIFLKNKIASSIMMLFAGVMMFIAALNGKGNDTKSLPILITSLGTILSLWAVYRFGYMKANFDRIFDDSREEKIAGRKVLLSQFAETLLYMLVAGLGVFLLSNEGFTNKILNLMAGGFTTLNGVLGAINAYKNRENKDFRWKFMLVLMVLELIIGPYFIIVSDSIDIPGYIIMGVITTVAGIIEVISALTRDNIRGTIKDGKDIVRIIKDGENPEE